MRIKIVIRNSIKVIPFIILLVLGVLMGLDFSLGIITQNKLVMMAMVMIFISLLGKRITLLLDTKVVRPFLNKLIISDNLRFSLLKSGAFLFTIAFTLQIIIIAYS